MSTIQEWTPEEKRYNDTISRVEYFYNGDRWMFDSLNLGELDKLLYYFGLGKYENDEFFLDRWHRIKKEYPKLSEEINKLLEKVSLLANGTTNFFD